MPGVRVLSMLLIGSDLEWCVHLGSSLFLYTRDFMKNPYCTSISYFICLYH